MVLYKDFQFVHQRLINLISRHHGIQVMYMEVRGAIESWNYDKLVAVFYNLKVTNAEVFAKGLEKCRLFTRLLGQKVENLDDYGCPKIQDLVKTDSSWICSNHPFRHKTRLHCAERKANVYGERLCNICKFLYVFNVFVFTTNLTLSTRRDFFYGIHFEKLSLRNR